MSYNNRRRGFYFFYLLVCMRVCVCVCVSKNPTRLLRPGDCGKSVLKFRDGQRLGGQGRRGEAGGGKEREKREGKKKKISGYITSFSGLIFWCLILIPTHLLPHTTYIIYFRKESNIQDKGPPFF